MLPNNPLSVGFYHTGQKQSSQFPLAELKKDAWVKIVVPVAELLDPKDVRRVQFNISESNYKHQDGIDFYIDDVVLTRFVEPAIAELKLPRRILFSHDRVLAIAQHWRTLDAGMAEGGVRLPTRDG